MEIKGWGLRVRDFGQFEIIKGALPTLGSHSKPVIYVINEMESPNNCKWLTQLMTGDGIACKSHI